jgi:hypothetical protein
LTRDATCECGNFFECEDRFAGGFANCPSCGKATAVPGLRDPLWRLAQAGGLLVWFAATAIAYATGGGGAALITAIIGAALLWALSRLF